MQQGTRTLLIALVVLIAFAVVGPALMGGMMGYGAIGPGMMGWGYAGAPQGISGWPLGIVMGLGGLVMLAFWGARAGILECVVARRP